MLNDWFPINAGMRLGCAMSPMLSNVNMDGVMKGIKVRVSKLYENGKT